jgi:LysM repeat protein
MQPFFINHVIINEVKIMIKIKRFIKLSLCTLLIVSIFFFANGVGNAKDNSIIIKKGDTLFSISRQYNLSVQELKEYNHLKDNSISVGQKIRIPSLKQPDPMYVVVAGSFAKKTNADRQISLLKRKGIEAVITKKVINNKKYYRIQAGVFSNKINAEKQLRILQNKGIKDGYILSEKPIHINGITVGTMYNQLLQQFGKPAKAEDHLNIRSLYYMNLGVGVRVNFNMENGSIFGLQVYPEYLNVDSIPNSKSDILDVYGYPSEKIKVSCYESATCEQLIYYFSKNKLIVQIDRDGETVQYLDLGRLQ